MDFQNENVIVEIDAVGLLSRDTLLSILEIEEPEERVRIRALLEAKAKELGIYSQFKKTVDSFEKAQEELDKQFRRVSAKKRFDFALQLDEKGNPASLIENFLRIFEHDPHFDGLRFNLLTYSPEQERDGKMERWLDSDDSETRLYVETKYHFHNIQKCDDALRIVFARNQYHPIRDLIDSFTWDGQNRIEDFLPKWTKCENTPYTREVSRLIFAGGIHRLYNPGCKFDDMPVLIGTKQGEGKSTLVRWLAMRDEYFTEVTEFDGQRGIESLEGAWICEVGELLALTKTKEQEAVKSFITRQNDRYRMPFDKRVTDHPRQCVFIGTTNKEQFLTDKTGNRRFYPVKVNQNGYDLFENEEEIKEYIRQCWAEAKSRYDDGTMKPYADRALIDVIRSEQGKAVEDDYRVGMIEEYLQNVSETCILDLWKNALKMGDFSKPTKKDSNEISIIMQSFDGWKKDDKVRRIARYGVQQCWSKVVPPTEEREGKNPPKSKDIDETLFSWID